MIRISLHVNIILSTAKYISMRFALLGITSILVLLMLSNFIVLITTIGHLRRVSFIFCETKLLAA
jgi:hypothetical protein